MKKIITRSSLLVLSLACVVSSTSLVAAQEPLTASIILAQSKPVVAATSSVPKSDISGATRSKAAGYIIETNGRFTNRISNIEKLTFSIESRIKKLESNGAKLAEATKKNNEIRRSIQSARNILRNMDKDAVAASKTTEPEKDINVLIKRFAMAKEQLVKTTALHDDIVTLLLQANGKAQ